MKIPLYFKIEEEPSGAFCITSGQLPGLLVAKMTRNAAIADLPRALDEYAAAVLAAADPSPSSQVRGQ